jgi:dipeptidyl aminopeptidase/acylaminoacyl peptidase
VFQLRHSIMTVAIAAVVAPACVGSAAAAAAQDERAVDLIPRESLFGNPDRAGVQTSPDGTRISFLAPKDDVLNVWVQTVGADDARPVTSATERPIRTYFWAHNSEQIIYAQDKAGDENWRLYAVNLATGDEVDLTPFDGVQARVVATDRNFPDEILAAVNNRNPQLHDVWRVNTRTGERSMVLENTEGWIGFVPDSQFNIRVVTRMTPTGGSDVFIRNADEEDFKPLASWDMQDALTSGPVGISRDGETLYLLDATGVDKAVIYAMDVTDEAMPRRVVFASDEADVSGALIDPETGHPQAVSWEYTRVKWKIMDPSIKSDWAYLQRVDDGDVSISSRDHADRHWIVVYVQDDGPVKYYRYDRDAKEATFLFTNRSRLEGLTLASMRPVVIDARDGLKLVSYLTTPPQTSAKNLPMVLLVHGGPWGRDSWGYNSIHQWLANRGYAVLSVNFRGSTGMGKDFINAGNREWAGKMHTDLIDAVEWAVDEGIADPERIAIMGGSYGGYATLVGLTFTPDVFAAGVDIVGPSHLRTLLESIPPYWLPIKSLFESRMGAMSETEFLDSISPLTKVDQIRRPLLIGQGANDPRVKQAESEQIVAAMQERDIPVTYVLFPDEGHGFARPANNLAFFAITETFLAQHLGGRYEPIDDDVRKSSAQIPAGAELLPGLEDAAKK